MDIPLPLLLEQNKHLKTINMADRINNLNNNLSKSEELFSSLRRKAFSGVL